MAGNKKTRRKPAPKGIGTPERALAVRRAAIAARGAAREKKQRRNERIVELPLGHPVNAYVLDWTFSPLDKMLNESEKSGSHLFDEGGNAVMWVERDRCYTPIVEACFELSECFGFIANERNWGEVPAGLVAYGLKLARGEKLDAQDIADAREAIAWMREHLAKITSPDWVHSMARMDRERKSKA